MYVLSSFVPFHLQNGVLSDTLVVKNYGAQKIYCVKQSVACVDSGVEDSSNSVKMRTSIASVQDQITAMSADFDDARARLSRLNHRRGLLERRELFRSRLSSLKAQVDMMRADRSRNKRKHSVTSLTAEQLNGYVGQYQDEYRKRKRIGVELLHYVSEACNSSKDEIMDELGLETDDNFPPQRGA